MKTKAGKTTEMENTDETAPAASTSATDVVTDSYTNLDDLQKRLQLLKMMQREYVRVEKDFHHQFYELDMEYQQKRQAVYNQRKAIINGSGDDSKPGEPTEIDLKGIPGFWLRALKNCTPNLIRDCDEEALNYLNDIKLNLMSKPPGSDDDIPRLSFSLEFEFAANPFFQNSTLTKQYFLDCESTEEFNGFSIVKTIGCEIKWNAGMDITETEPNSFFVFFNPPEMNEDAAADDGSTLNESNELQQAKIFEELQRDFEIGLMLKEKLVPNAILYYLDEFEEVIDCSTLDDCETIETTVESTEL